MTNNTQLTYEPTTAWSILKSKEIMQFANSYMQFIARAKTEFETTSQALEMLKADGFVDINTKKTLQAGDKVYFNYEDRLLLAFKIVKSKPSKFKMIVSHIDSPRLDLKIRPFKEDDSLLFLKTHYYGGIKKYQWTALPLAIHGKIVNSKGKIINISLGEDEKDPIFAIPDLLPHLGKKQLEKSAKEFISGENLQMIFSHIPQKDKDGKWTIKKRSLKLLFDRYEITEKDFITADLRIVPAISPKDLGLDKGLILAYGQDDRVCAYASLRAFIDSNSDDYIQTLVFIDKEEIGSAGRSSANSQVIKYVLAMVLKKMGRAYTEYDLREAFIHSKALSSDVDAVFNPIYSDPFDKDNTAKLGFGPALVKYTGYGGKFASSEATAQYMAEIIKTLDHAKVPWQIGMLGKIDVGGGGTIAKFFDNLGVQTVDFGPGVLSMHSPLEITSKADVYATYLAYKAFWEG